VDPADKRMEDQEEEKRRDVVAKACILRIGVVLRA
jgi:hypothetical protein